MLIPRRNLFLYLLCACTLGLALVAQAQEIRPKDPATKPDSTRFYKELKEKSKRRKFTKWLFETVVVIKAPRKPLKPARFGKPEKIVNPFEVNAGKVIRTIDIRVLEPFGYSVNDTSRRPRVLLEKYGNNLHLRSRQYLIRNQLLFELYHVVDPLKMSESERILRQAPYINDARIYFTETIPAKDTSCPDSVDVQVFVQDQWSITPESYFDPTVPNLLLTEQNLLGLGVQARQNVSYKFSDKSWSHYGRYGHFNIRRTFLSAYLSYEVEPRYQTVGVTVDRPFYSPLTRWAGGASANRYFNYFVRPFDTSAVIPTFPITYDVYDAWLGKSWQLERGYSVDNRSTALIGAGRVVHTRYYKRPGNEIDVYGQNSNQTVYLAAVGVSRREFYKEKYLYRFGANEDVPIGFSFQLIGGYRSAEFFATQYYTGVSGSAGGLLRSVGYVAVQVAYGNFYNKNSVDAGVLRGNLNYFSNLQTVGRWGIRQFASFNTVFGFNRLPYEFVNLNGSQLYGFNSATVMGRNKAILNLETVFYMPYNLLGFRLAPVLFLGFGKVGNSMESLLFGSPIYPAISLGLLVRNENLVFNTFELSIGFYPYLPGGTDFFRLAPVTSYRLRVRDFALPRPEVVGYN